MDEQNQPHSSEPANSPASDNQSNASGHESHVSPDGDASVDIDPSVVQSNEPVGTSNDIESPSESLQSSHEGKTEDELIEMILASNSRLESPANPRPSAMSRTSVVVVVGGLIILLCIVGFYIFYHRVVGAIGQ